MLTFSVESSVACGHSKEKNIILEGFPRMTAVRYLFIPKIPKVHIIMGPQLLRSCTYVYNQEQGSTCSLLQLIMWRKSEVNHFLRICSHFQLLRNLVLPLPSHQMYLST